jgi:hypothetical protein
VKLLASDGAEYDYFGYSVSLSGDNALVGAYQDANEKGSYAGSAYYYGGLNGKSGEGTVYQDVKLLASDGAASDNFGYSVSLSGDNALVGAYYDDGKESDSGSAYYYGGLNVKSGTVTQDVKLIASDGAANDYFGVSVSLSGDNALVGAYGDANKGGFTGSAYYYGGLTGKSGTVTQDVKLLASDDAQGDYFGYSVSLSGDNALVGAYGNDNKAATDGSAYYYRGLNAKIADGLETVTQDVKLLASDGAEYDYFGYSVSLSGDRFVITAYGADPAGMSNVGKAYAGDIRAYTTLFRSTFGRLRRWMQATPRWRPMA